MHGEVWDREQLCEGLRREGSAYRYRPIVKVRREGSGERERASQPIVVSSAFRLEDAPGSIRKNGHYDPGRRS